MLETFAGHSGNSAATSDHLDLRPLPTADVLGIRFHAITIEQAVSAIEVWIQQKLPRQVCLGNAYTISLVRKDPALKELINRSDLVLADGMSVVWGGHWVGARLPERVAGPDLMEALCRRAAQLRYRIFLMGATESTLQKLQEKLLRICPGLLVVGVYSPPMCDQLPESENLKIIQSLHAAKPDILFVGMSCPKQERWIARNLPRLNVPVSLGVGAAFDFLSGKIPRAPHSFQTTGTEWLYRLYREPRRLWKRYLLGNLVFLSLLTWNAVARHLQPPGKAIS
jgi:N-acetylglucosaminyldiphosphoundecaprenol N-acetyl-beta-D-mannosaminyltransferase